MKLSAVVINKNGGKKLAGCLESLKFCDEVLLIDSGSTDNSLGIAGKNQTRIIKVESRGFFYSRNIGAQEAKGDWLLYIDTDERISPDLEKVIIESISNSSNSSNSSNPSYSSVHSFKIYRQNIILGKWLRHGDWWPDPVHRLIKKSALVKWRGKLHESPIVKETIGLIREPIIHLSKDSISEMIGNSKIFAPIEARLMFQALHPPVKIYHFLLAMWREFWRRGVIKMGWLDGVIGITEVFYQMFHQFLVYSILWQMQKKRSSS